MAEILHTPHFEPPKVVGEVPMQTVIGIAGLPATFPPREAPHGPPGMWMGMIRTLAFGYAPFGAPSCGGQLMPIAQNPALLSILGTSFGGDGATTFGLPDLRGNIATGGEQLGEQLGNMLACNAMVAVSPPAVQSNFPMVGMVAMFGGPFAPQGWLRANGINLVASEYGPLSQAIGTTFGSDGPGSFHLPDLTTIVGPPQPGNPPVGVGQGPMTPPVALGQEIAPFGLGLNYMISLKGVFPAQGGNGALPLSDPILGEITAYAGPTIPAGWALADGSLISIFGNETLFALIGTTYGGDGQTNFALPDLRGSAVKGATA